MPSFQKGESSGVLGFKKRRRRRRRSLFWYFGLRENGSRF
jgi:hypothetical protein